MARCRGITTKMDTYLCTIRTPEYIIISFIYTFTLTHTLKITGNNGTVHMGVDISSLVGEKLTYWPV